MQMSKEESCIRECRIPVEPLILYFVLFFPGVYASGFPVQFSAGLEGGETIPFSALRELGRTLTYTVPSLALLWYLILGKKPKKIKYFSDLNLKKTIKRAFIPFIAGLPGLIIIGLSISFLIAFFIQAKGLPSPPKVEAPRNPLSWTVMVLSCIGTGYLEESYFRYYLLTKLKNLLITPVKMIILSTILFSVCHIYEGPWGILNATLAGILLSLLFIRYKSLHGIAWAHACYNIFVYVMGNFGS